MLRLLASAVAALAVAVDAGTAAAARHAPTPTSPNAGIVNIVTSLGYQRSSAAGTGMILTPSGEVLTNNHVIRGATSIRAVDVTTHRSYPANVVGYSVTRDVAVLQLQGAGNLATVRLGNSSKLRVGQTVTARGNAGGLGGAPKVATGRITGLGRSIVAGDGEGSSERLVHLIETNAPVEPGDSGGPLLNAAGRVVGMVTAGSVAFRFQSAAGAAYAIPVNRALAVARQIESGNASADVHVGPTAFLGVQVSDPSAGSAVRGALVAAVVPGTAAEAAGLAAGDVITTFDGRPVAAADDLSPLVVALVPGTTVAVDIVDATGIAETLQITPGAGPPQ